jgi:5'-methylthioadenosine phosphorylase
MPGLTDVEEISMETPFGAPSDHIRLGTLEGRRVAFLARHGRHHSLLPSELPQRANFWALKKIGIRRVIAVSAVGSLREDYRPGEMVVPDQVIDRTSGMRPATFFGDGAIAHVGMATPFCERLRGDVRTAAGDAGATAHGEGAYVVIEGPAFGTAAESHMYRQWGASIVGMTAMPEAKLAREAELCYAILAAVTDYDAWHSEHDAVDATTVFRMLLRNVEMSRETIRKLLTSSEGVDDCACQRALDNALVTRPEAIPSATRERLGPILARRLEARG